MTDNTRPRSTAASTKAVGLSGVVQYGGILYHDDQDRAWRGLQRDRTIQAMLNDPIIGAVLYAMEMMIRRVNWHVETADENNPQAEMVYEFVESALEDMDGMWPGDTMADMLTYLGWGYAVLEIVYKQRVGPYEADKSKRSKYSDGLIGWRCWDLRPQSTRYAWEFKDGEAVGFTQQVMTSPMVTVPLSKCIHIKYQSGNGSPEGKTPLRHAYDAWYYKRNIQRIEGIGIERDLAGLPVFAIPGRDIEENSETAVAAQNVVTGIRNDAMAGAVISSDRDENGNLLQELTLLSSGGTRQFDTDAIIRRYSNDVVNAFLASVLRSGQDGIGTQALSTTMSDLFMQSLAAHLDIIQTAIMDQALPELMRVNGWPLELMPTIKHGDIESADIQRVGAYLQQLSNAGLLVDTPALREFVHELAELPVPDAEEMQAEMDQQATDKQAEADAMAEQMRQQQDASANSQEIGGGDA